MQLNMSAKYVVLSMLTLSSSWAAEDGYLTNESEDSAGAPHRVRIPPFTLTFSPSSGFTDTQEDLIEELAEDVLHDFFPTKVGAGVTVDYVDLIINNRALIRKLRRLQQNGTQVLQIAGGIASFRGGEPTLDEVNAWVSEALQENLLELLQEETDMNTVDSIVFNSLTTAPTAAPRAFDGVAVSDNSSQDSPRSSAFSLVASVVGGAAFVCLVVLAALSRRRRHGATVEPIVADKSTAKKDFQVTPDAVHDDLAATGCDESDEDETLETGQNLPNLVRFEDADSVSYSMGTMSTNATDAYTVKSGKVFPRTSHALMQTESFERDRQVSLKKDMLETTWSSAIPHETVSKAKDTLLSPSHFSAVVEQSQSTDSYEVDRAWNPDDNEVSSSVDQDAPFLFAAQGEEVVLMPPSRVRSSRRGL